MLTVSRLGDFRRVVRNVQFGDGALNARQNLGDVFAARLVQHDCELLAAVARNEVQRPPRALAQGHRNGAQAFISGLMPITIVVVLEAIDVRQQHCDALLFAHRLLPDPR